MSNFKKRSTLQYEQKKQYMKSRHVSRSDRTQKVQNEKKKRKAESKFVEEPSLADERDIMLTFHNEWHSAKISVPNLSHLISRNAPLDITNDKGLSPLGVSLLHYEGRREVSDYGMGYSYCSHGDWDYYFAPNGNLLSLLDYAEKRHRSWERLLGTKMQCLHMKNHFGNTILHCACRYGKVKIVRELLRLGASVQTRNKDRNQAIHMACEKNNPFLIKLLLQHQASIKTRNRYGNLPLHIACLYENIIVAKYLLDLGSPAEDKNNSDQTPFDLACSSDNVDIALFLLKYCGKKMDHDPVCVAVQYNAGEVLEMLLEDLALIKCPIHQKHVLIAALERGNDVLSTRQSKFSFLFSSYEKKSIDKTLEIILKHITKMDVGKLDKTIKSLNAFINVQNKYGNTLLHYACYYNMPKVVTILLQSGAQVLPNDDGDTALHVSCFYGHNESIEILLEFGANPYHLNNTNLCPLSIACKEQHLDTVKLLAGGKCVNPNNNLSIIDNKDRSLRTDAEIVYRSPIYLAAKHMPRAVQVLLQNGAEINNPSCGLILPTLICTSMSDCWYNHLDKSIIYQMLSAGAILNIHNRQMINFENHIYNVNDTQMITNLTSSGHRFSIHLGMPTYLQLMKSEPYYLQCLAAKEIRTHLLPNAWVAIGHVPLPLPLKRYVVMYSDHANLRSTFSPKYENNVPN